MRKFANPKRFMTAHRQKMMVFRLMLLTVGIGLAAVGTRWLFLAGLLCVVCSRFFYRRPSSLMRLLDVAFYAAILVFLIWYSSSGTQKPRVAIFVLWWLAAMINEWCTHSGVKGAYGA